MQSGLPLLSLVIWLPVFAGLVCLVIGEKSPQGARWVAALVAVSYVGFAGVTVLALVRHLPIDSCGCLGRMETPPSWRHLLVLGAAAAGALGAAVAPRPTLLERLGDGAGGVVFALAALACTAGAVALMRIGRRPT